MGAEFLGLSAKCVSSDPQGFTNISVQTMYFYDIYTGIISMPLQTAGSERHFLSQNWCCASNAICKIINFEVTKLPDL